MEKLLSAQQQLHVIEQFEKLDLVADPRDVLVEVLSLVSSLLPNNAEVHFTNDCFIEHVVHSNSSHRINFFLDRNYTDTLCCNKELVSIIDVLKLSGNRARQ